LALAGGTFLLAFGFWILAFSSFLFNQHIHFSLPTVLNTFAHTLASFFWLLAFGG
jgi:hypothetical protein